MRKYNVEPDLGAIYRRIGSKRKVLLTMVIAPILLPLMFSGGPLWFYWLQHQVNFPCCVYIVLIHFLYSVASFAWMYIYYKVKKKAFVQAVYIEPLLLIHFFWGAVFFGLAADYSKMYIVFIVTLFLFSNLMILCILNLSDGALIGREFERVFISKDQETIILYPDYNDDVFFISNKCNKIIRKTKFGWTATVFSSLMWIVFPISMYVFSDVFVGDNVVSSGVVGLLSVICLMVYLGTRKTVLCNLIVYKAIRRREMGYGVDNFSGL